MVQGWTARIPLHPAEIGNGPQEIGFLLAYPGRSESRLDSTGVNTPVGASLALASRNRDFQIQCLSIVKLDLQIDDASQGQVRRTIAMPALPPQYYPLPREVDNAKLAIEGRWNQSRRIDDPEKLPPLNLSSTLLASLIFPATALRRRIASSVSSASIVPSSVRRKAWFHGANSPRLSCPFIAARSDGMQPPIH